MPDFSNFVFDAAGVSDRRTQARIGEWARLELLQVGLLLSKQPTYYVNLGFAEGEQLDFFVSNNWLGRPRVAPLAEALRLATTHAPATAEISARARLVVRWGSVEPFEAAQLKAIGTDCIEAERLLRAAQWRWVHLHYGRAIKLARAAARLSSGNAEPWKILLQIALERRRPRHEIAALCQEVLAREPDNPEARATQIQLALVERRADAEASATAWLREHPDSLEVAVACVEFLVQAERFAEAKAVIDALLTRRLPSVRREAFARHAEELQRLASDAEARERRRRRVRLVRTLMWAPVAIGVLIAALGAYFAISRVREGRARDAMKKQAVEAVREPVVRAKGRAEAGDPAAMLQFAAMVETGIFDTPPDPAAAHAWRLRAAEANHVPAMLEVAREFQLGHKVPRDLAAAQRWLERAAAAGSAEAAAQLGDWFFAGADVPRDYARALTWYEQAAGRNDVHSQRQLALMHERGLGTAKDPAEAFRRFRALADGGDAVAQNHVGWMLTRGIGAARDDAAALGYFRRAAESGDTSAQANLGLAYAYGRGVPRDEAEGIRWLERAAEKKNALALMNLGLLHINGQGVPKDPARGAELVRQAAELNNPDAQFILAQLQRAGTGLPKDARAARQTLERLWKAGYSHARFQLADIYLKGAEGIPPDLARARQFLERNDEEEAAWGTLRLALLQWHGLGGPRDAKAAIANLRRIEQGGEPAAAVFLADMLATGSAEDGIAPDSGEGRRVLEVAAAAGNTLAVSYLKRISEGATLAGLVAGTEPVNRSAPSPAREEALPDERLPQPVFQARPHYPLAMQYLGLEGEVKVDFIVTPEGAVANARSVSAKVAPFAPAAVAAVEAWRFKPGVKAGRAVPTHMQVPIVFTLDAESPVDAKRSEGPAR